MTERAAGKKSAKTQRSDMEYYFGQLTGTEEPDLDIVRPKLTTLINTAADIGLNLTEFARGIRSIGYENDADSIDTLVTAGLEFKEFATRSESRLNKDTWSDVKEHDFIQSCLFMCNKLSEIHTHLDFSWSTVDRKFMNRYSGLTFKPFSPRCEIDIKYLWLIDGEANPDLRELIFTVLKNVYKAAYGIFNVYMSPDVNIAEITKIIISSLGNLKKEIPRCEKAFEQIEKSAAMLNDNFTDYYRDYLQTRDPNNIFTAFISDVGASCGNDTQLIYQCRRIVQYYKKNVQRRIASGEITGEKRKMFESLLENYKVIDRSAAAKIGAEEEPPEPAVETPEEDARDLDELISQIENPKVMSISDKPKKSGRSKSS